MNMSGNDVMMSGNGQMSNNNGGTNKSSRCNLIINYLPQSLKENDFNMLFSKIGPLKTCKLMYDRQTGYSFGYGFVEYVTEDDARKAVESLNGYQIEHKRHKVAFARPNCEETKNTNLYIRNIPVSYDEQQLHELFSQHGDVIQVRLLRDQNTAFSRRIGFVIMATKQMAQNAIQKLDNTVPPNGGSEPIYVKYADEEGKKRHNQNGNNNGNLRGFNQNPQNNFQSMNNNNFQQNMAPHGFGFNNPNSFIMSGGSNGAGAFGNHHLQQQQTPQALHPHQQQQQLQPFGNTSSNSYLMAAAAAVAGLGGGSSVVGGNLLDVSGGGNGVGAVGADLKPVSIGGGLGGLSGSSGGLSSGHIIYVYGIGQANESELYSLFTHCGRIMRVNVIKNQKTGQCKGYGFVVFETYEEAYYAVHNMNGYMYNHRPLQVSLKSLMQLLHDGMNDLSLSSSSSPQHTPKITNNTIHLIQQQQQHQQQHQQQQQLHSQLQHQQQQRQH